MLSRKVGSLGSLQRRVRYPAWFGKFSCGCMHAPISTFAATVWPCCDAQCNAVFLQTNKAASHVNQAPAEVMSCSPHCVQNCTRHRTYPSLSGQCTSAPSVTSTSVVSVWPVLDEKCSAVHLHGQRLPSSRHVLAMHGADTHVRSGNSLPRARRLATLLSLRGLLLRRSAGPSICRPNSGPI
jgi:hypothetical protein